LGLTDIEAIRANGRGEGHTKVIGLDHLNAVPTSGRGVRHCEKFCIPFRVVYTNDPAIVGIDVKKRPWIGFAGAAKAVYVSNTPDAQGPQPALFFRHCDLERLKRP